MNRGLLIFALILYAASRLPAQEETPGRVIAFDLGVKFTLPHGWMVLQEPAAVPAAATAGKEPVVLFYARPDDPSFIPGPKWLNEAWVSVSKLPAPQTTAAGEGQPPPGADETEALKEALTQEGYRISESTASSQVEGDVRASSARLYCYSEVGPPIIVEVSRWEANGEVIVAQLRYSEAVRADLRQNIQDLKGSFQRNGQPTLAFGVGLAKGGDAVAGGPSPSAAAASSPAAAGAQPSVPSQSASAGASPSPAEDRSAEIIRNLTDSLVFIEGENKAGSGFICNLEKHKCLVTNIHVMNENKNPKFTLLDGSPIQVGDAYAAVDHDIFSFLVTSGGKEIEVMQSVEQNVAIDDEVVVLGNAEGARVINAIEGTVVGIGPNLVEVSAPFVAGNSGSPVIHKKTGKVIGVATYIVERITPAGNRAEAPERKIRRFAYRLDTIKKWQPVYWPEFYDEGARMDNIELVTRDLETFCRELAGGRLRPGSYKAAAIQTPVENYMELTGGTRRSRYDLLNAKKDLLLSIRSASQQDVSQAKTKLTYDYFQRELMDQQGVRDAFAKYFDSLSDLH